MTLMVQPHYQILQIKTIDELKKIFPDAQADYMNFCLFSTSGVHGTYMTIEDCLNNLAYELTVLVVHPRIVALRYGQIKVEKKDSAYLKKLRKTSAKVASKIGLEP